MSYETLTSTLTHEEGKEGAKGRFISYIAFQISPEIITINYKTYRKTNATVPLAPAPQKAKERNQNQAHTPYSVSL